MTDDGMPSLPWQMQLWLDSKRMPQLHEQLPAIDAMLKPVGAEALQGRRIWIDLEDGRLRGMKWF